MSICLLLIDDGREDYLARCLESMGENLPGVFDHAVTVLDPEHELGFAGAIQRGWQEALETGAEWVFHVEGDFLFNEPVDVERMVGVLRRTPHLSQMSLLRQPWNPEEREAGGIVHQHPDDFWEVRDGDDVWTETQRYCFTTNPSVYSMNLCKRGFPDPPESEGRFGLKLAAEGRRLGIWGGKWDSPRVSHIGDTRAGVGY
jgi:hypothetical protein